MASCLGCTFGKCDHFRLPEEGRGLQCYIVTRFDCGRCSPVRSFIATRDCEEERVSGNS